MEIEITAKTCFNFGMGPFELMNVTGVPIAVHALDGLAQALGDFYRPDPLLGNQAQKGLWSMEKLGEAAANRNITFTTVPGTHYCHRRHSGGRRRRNAVGYRSRRQGRPALARRPAFII